MTDHPTTTSIPIACNVLAIDVTHREQHGLITQELFAAVLDVEELPTGYGFRLPEDMLLKIAAFIADERLCCPFFTFSLEVEPNRGPLWFRLTGSAEIKQLMQAEFGSLLSASLVQKMGGA